MLTDKSYITAGGGRGGGDLREREEGDIFPLHVCSCPDQLEYFSQLFQRQPTLSLRGKRSGKLCFPLRVHQFLLNHITDLSGFPYTVDGGIL